MSSAAKKSKRQCTNSSEAVSAAEVPKALKSKANVKPSPLPLVKPAKKRDEEELASLLKWKAAIEADDPAKPKQWEEGLYEKASPETVASIAHQESGLTAVQESARERGQRDLFFFCKEILGYKDMLPRVHQQVCDVYGPIDLKKPFEDQDTIHNYLILDPRGEFKTSISIGKAIQNWINFPEVATLRMSGIETLVKRTIQEVRAQLTTNSELRTLYREHVPWSDKKNEQGLAPSEWGTAFGITNPSRETPRREPTLSISTLESVKAGSHYEWVCGDDLVHEKNYQTRDLLQKTIDDWDLARNLLNPRGYRELCGTRYDWSDLYGRTIETNKGQWRIHCRPIWTDDLGFARANGFAIPETYQPGDLLLLHPERWGLQELLEIQADNPYLFNCQRLNNPIPSTADNFPLMELVKHTVKREKYPDTGLLNIFMTWYFDLADPEADPCVGVVAGWDAKGRLFIIDLVTGRFKPSTLIDLIIAFWQKWPVSRVGFEDSRKQRMLEPGLMSRLRTMKLSFAIDWVKFGGNMQTDDDKIHQVLALEPLLRENQLWFHGELPHLNDLYLQFTRFPKFKLRGIPVAISRLMYYRTQTQTMGNLAVYGSELYSPSLSWNHDDESLGAGLIG